MRSPTWSAAAVHLLTASGIVCALLAMRATWAGAWEAAFAWLALALVIDGVDGTFARLARVTERLPRFSGERLDLVIDYVTYVFVPVLLLERAGYLSGYSGLVLSCLILTSSLYHFSDTGSKADDHSFVGFPAVWNAVALYVFAFALPQWLTALIVCAGVVLTFIPMRWVHPMRTPTLQWATIALTAAGAVAAGFTLLSGFPANAPSKVVLGGVAIYFISLAVLRPRAR